MLEIRETRSRSNHHRRAVSANIDVFINRNAGMLFGKLTVDKDMWDKILVIVLRERHQRGRCWNGLFKLSNFVMLSGRVRMSANVPADI